MFNLLNQEFDMSELKGGAIYSSISCNAKSATLEVMQIIMQDDYCQNKYVNAESINKDADIRAVKLALASIGKLPKSQAGSIQAKTTALKNRVVRTIQKYGGDITKITILQNYKTNGSLLYFNIFIK